MKDILPARGSSMQKALDDVKDELFDLQEQLAEALDQLDLRQREINRLREFNDHYKKIIDGVRDERDALKAIIESGSAEERVARFLVRIKDVKTQVEAPGEAYTLRMNVVYALQQLFEEAGLA